MFIVYWKTVSPRGVHKRIKKKPVDRNFYIEDQDLEQFRNEKQRVFWSWVDDRTAIRDGETLCIVSEYESMDKAIEVRAELMKEYE